MTSDIIGRVGRRVAKVRRKMTSVVVTPSLARRSKRSRESLVDPSNSVVVCLTSYGARLATVHLTIESIARGRARPARLILWTDPGVDDASLPSTLTRLRNRGLEILPSPAALGPHTKYYPYVVSHESHRVPLVTADDDSIYPRYWLARLQTASLDHPDEIVCYRAHRIRFPQDGALAPYNTWGPVQGPDSSFLNFATGVSGVLYPPGFLSELRVDGDDFQVMCPRADDVWLHYRAFANGRRIRQIVPSPKKFPELAATQATALHRTNTGQSANDAQIVATYDSATLSALRAEARSR